MAADLTTTVTESVVLNGALRGNTNSVTTTGIENVFERIVTCIHSNVTTVAVFDTAPFTSAGAIDVENVRYVRVTNLDEDGSLDLVVATTVSSYTVLLTPGNSHILCLGEEVAVGEVGAPSFPTLSDLASLQISPVGAVYSPQVAVFVASV